VAAEQRQERQQGRRLDEPAPEGVRDRHRAGAYRLHEAGHAERRVAAQRERIAEVVVEPAHDHVDTLEPLERLQVHDAVAHRQVPALDETEAEVACEVGLLEVRLVVRPGREQDDARHVVPSRREPGEGRAEAREERREPRDVAVAEELGQRARQRDPVLERVSGAGRRLRAVSQDPPPTVGGACEVGRVQVEEAALRRLHAVAGAEEPRMREHDLGREALVAEQALRAVEVGKDQVQELGPLLEAGREPPPLGRRHEQRQRVELPRAVGAARVAVDVVRDAVVADQPAGALPALRRLRRAEVCEAAYERRPVRARRAAWLEHLVVRAGSRPVVSEQRRFRGRGRGRLRRAHARRRSSVNGNSAGGAGAAGSIAPPVRPSGEKRAARRASASFAFTGNVS
jgi:hypothetical protein